MGEDLTFKTTGKTAGVNPINFMWSPWSWKYVYTTVERYQGRDK